MKTIRLAAVLVALSAFGAQAFAADATCAAQATEKKLAGAAKTSFLKKCENDTLMANPAYAGCEKAAADKKLAGAAKTSSIKKCVAGGAAAPAAAASGAKK